jgi:RNA polymerase sigma-70 factor (ECF subfamily)
MEHDMQDAEAIRRLKRGEIDGLEVLVTRYQQPALHAAYLVLQDEALAEDVVQETFVKLFRRIRSFDETRSFEPYLLRSVVNAALTAAGKAGREILLDDGNGEVDRLISQAASVETQVEANELEDRLLAAIAGLPLRQRAVIVQRYYLDMSESEMAQALDAPPGTVKWLLNAARTRLRALLGSERSKG